MDSIILGVPLERSGNDSRVDYKHYLEEARNAGVVDGAGVFTADYESMKKKLSTQLHKKEGLWLVCLLQALQGPVDLQTSPGKLMITFPSKGLPTPGEVSTQLMETDAKPVNWLFIRAFLGLPSHLQVRWSGPDGTLSRRNSTWAFEEGTGPNRNQILVENFITRDNWQRTLQVCRSRIPLPPYPLTLNSHPCWRELEMGGTAQLLASRFLEGHELKLRAADLKKDAGGFLRLGLHSRPTHRLVYLNKGVRVHEHPLPFETKFLCSEVFLPGEALSTDLSGLQIRETEEKEKRVHADVKRVSNELRALCRELLSREELPLQREEKRRRDSLVGSVAALGGLSLVQLPFFSPLLTVGVVGMALGGTAAYLWRRSGSEPWRGKPELVRQDLERFLEPNRPESP